MFKVGDKVAIHKPTDMAIVDNIAWVTEMDKYDGKVATIACPSPHPIHTSGNIFMIVGSPFYFHRNWLYVLDVRSPIQANSMPVNDHICPTCKNDRCSKTEKSCWRCGNSLHP